jgi:hypothetical protein
MGYTYKTQSTWHITYVNRYTGAHLTCRITAYTRSQAISLAVSMYGASRSCGINAYKVS